MEKRFNFVLKNEDLEMLQQAAKVLGVSASAFVRMATMSTAVRTIRSAKDAQDVLAA